MGYVQPSDQLHMLSSLYFQSFCHPCIFRNRSSLSVKWMNICLFYKLFRRITSFVIQSKPERLPPYWLNLRSSTPSDMSFNFKLDPKLPTQVVYPFFLSRNYLLFIVHIWYLFSYHTTFTLTRRTTIIFDILSRHLFLPVYHH